jgi:DNA-binding transcriptional ArsR family regulator
MPNPIEKIFGSRLRAKILAWLFTHTEESFFVRQLASILKDDPTNLSREMARLETLGILRSKRGGQLKHFQANRACPFFKELKGLVLKTAGVEGKLGEMLKSLPGIDYAFIFGAYAEGQETAGGEIDLMIIGEEGADRLNPSLNRVGRKLGREIHYVLYSMDEFNAKKKEKDGFLMDVLKREKIMLAGTEDGLTPGLENSTSASRGKV